jgi:hypothetical protein
MRASILLLLIAPSFVSTAQKKYTWNELLVRMAASDTSALRIYSRDSIIIKDTDFDSNGFSKLPSSITDSSSFERGRLIIHRNVYIFYPKISTRQIFELHDLAFRNHLTIWLEDVEFQLHNSVFKNDIALLDRDNSGHDMIFTNNKCQGKCSFFLKTDYVQMFNNSFEVSGPTKFESILSQNNKSLGQVLDTLRIYGEKIFPPNRPYIMVETHDNKFVKFNSNVMSSKWEEIAELKFINVDELHVSYNRFDPYVRFAGSANERFYFLKNKFYKPLSLGDLFFPTHSKVDWNSIKPRLAYYLDSTVAFKKDSTQTTALYFYNGSTHKSLVNEKGYSLLVETYKQLYDLYKGNGDLKSSNAVFVTVKDLEGERLQAIYKLRGGFENYFSWKLNSLMKFYTNHATNPARALVVSVYILLGFAVVYFFFPSDWDIESKSKLLRHYRDFIKKNDKGYIKPFLKLTWGFVVSLINAITLSLNSFITLGFGNIPTKGIARYVCIIQGFIGWFLLSIFTVALFNQVLF